MGNEKGRVILCPQFDPGLPGGGCAQEECGWWDAVAGDCAFFRALVAIPAALAELNIHLADLVGLAKRMMQVADVDPRD